MLRHSDIWAAIDRLARDRGLTASGLARRSGLDPTTFNKSKRITREGKPRWPSTESIAKVLDATGASLSEFLALLPDGARAPAPRALPLLSSVEVQASQRLNGELQAALDAADEVTFPDAGDKVFAVEVSDRRFEPAYRLGDVLIVAADMRIRRGDRVLVRTAGGEMTVAEVLRFGTRQLLLRPLARPDAGTQVLPARELSWIARILWASQ